MGSQHDYNIAAEPDVSGKSNRQIWYYFIALGVLLSLTMLGLDILYRFQVDYEKERKIGIVSKKESMDYLSTSQSYLSGKQGLIEGKRFVSIDDAMNKFLSDLRKAK